MSEREELTDDEQRLIDACWDELEAGDVAAARHMLADLSAEARETPDALELAAEVALAIDNPAAALEAYGRWSAVDPDDPEPWLAAAEVHLEHFEEPDEAAQLLRKLLSGPPLDSLIEADARHLLGLVCESRRDHKGMLREWIAVLRLDEANDGAEPLIPPEQFETIAGQAIEELPEELLAHLANVPVLIEDRPSEALVLEGLDPRTLGLFHGIAMPHQSALGGGPEIGLIHLFQRNLERDSYDEDDLAEQIRITVIHETAHYFGASEDDLERFGLN